MLDLLDYRRRVTRLYGSVRIAEDTGQIPAVWEAWRATRDELFATHPQSALDDAQKATFEGLRYYDYDPAYRVVAQLDDSVDSDVFHVQLDDDGDFRYRRIGQVTFRLPTGTGTLSVFWIMGYGGGIFVPFGDTTNKAETYGAGRYLIDTIKGADLGTTLEGDMVLDFNFAYNPSCAYNYRWVCPLAPQENKLPFAIPVGEKVLT